ncbi:hypothetical protein ACFV5N_21185 [Streptomyces sp. NPDC059853]|uniref:hypothetical protein n=1 Tax=Streptomyces sp. NPDC059853 TaxID=3346973 RepID=UPI00365A725A
MEQRAALTELVRQRVGERGRDGRLTQREFLAAAVDPDTGYQPSLGLIGKISRGESIQVRPELISALAAGLGLPRAVVAAAAHLQLLGYEAEELGDGSPAVLLRQLGDGTDERVARETAERWGRER